jgi:hypothetical protein
MRGAKNRDQGMRPKFRRYSRPRTYRDTSLTFLLGKHLGERNCSRDQPARKPRPTGLFFLCGELRGMAGEQAPAPAVFDEGVGKLKLEI